MLILAIVALAAAGGGYLAGRERAERRLTRLFKTDQEFSQTVMEQLAARWGAKLELFSPPGSRG
jgi:hypothetical protein